MNKTLPAHTANEGCRTALAGFIQAYGGLSDIEEYEVLGLVRHECAEVAPDDAVPGRAVLLIEKCLETKHSTAKY